MYRTLFILIILLLPPQAHSSDNNGDYTEEIEYRLVTPHQKMKGSEIEVVEFFWYKCPFCFYFESHINNWLSSKPENIKFIRIPAIKRKGWKMHAQAYYTAESLGVLEKIHTPLFKAIHEDRRELKTEETLADFFTEHGVSRVAFNEAFNSSTVQQKIEYAEKLTKHYQLSGVPTLLVNRKYLTDGSMAGGLSEITAVVNHLITKDKRNIATQ